MGAIHLNKDDQRVIMLALKQFAQTRLHAVGTDARKDGERAARLYRAVSQYELEATPEWDTNHDL